MITEFAYAAPLFPIVSIIIRSITGRYDKIIPEQASLFWHLNFRRIKPDIGFINFRCLQRDQLFTSFIMPDAQQHLIDLLPGLQPYSQPHAAASLGCPYRRTVVDILGVMLSCIFVQHINRSYSCT